MKRIIFILFVFVLQNNVNAQINLGKKIKEKITERVDQKTDKAIDNGLDSVENSTKKTKTKTETEDGVTKTKTKTDSNGSDADMNKNEKNSAAPSFASYSKFDFVPGEQVVFYDDLSQDAIGDFPANWNTTASGEVVTLNSQQGKWLKLVPNAYGNAYSPLLKNPFPDNFTLEYDIVATHKPDTDVPAYYVLIYSSKDKNLDASNQTGDAGMNTVFFQNWAASNWSANGDNATGKITEIPMDGEFGKKIHFSFWRQKERVRVYINETKVLDLPKILPAGYQYNKINFLNVTPEGSGDVFISNVRIAVGAPDMRSKLITEGKLITRGILFDVNSDKIKAESYGTLKEIAQVLKDNAAVKVKIIGHTDSDGSASSNLELSKKRAAAVKNSLSKDFGIDASRMETDGKGATEPASPNTTAEGKANNRRVEFIKL